MWNRIADLISNFGVTNWIMAGLSVLLGVIAWRQTHRLREDKKIKYFVGGVCLFNNYRTGLNTKTSLRVGNSSLEAGYYFVILIENIGTRAVEPHDFNAEGLIIKTASTRPGDIDKIAFIELASADDAAEAFELKSRNGSVEITFDHISPNSGFAIHGISTLPPHQLIVKGKLKSFGMIRKGNFDPNDLLFFSVLFALIFVVSPLLLFVILPEFRDFYRQIENPLIRLTVLISVLASIPIFMHAGAALLSKLCDKITVSRAGAARAYYLEKVAKLKK